VETVVLNYQPQPDEQTHRGLLRQLLLLSDPVLAEQILHMIVGLTDTYLATHLPGDSAAATAAVGNIAYFLWFIGLIVGAVATGASAIIARAVGAKHRSLANSICGQSISTALVIGILQAGIFFLFAGYLVNLTGLQGQANHFAFDYLRMLTPALPFFMLMLVASACLRGAGDTLTPAVVMIVVDVINAFFTITLTRGHLGFPRWGFNGIAAGTVIAYIVGGIIMFVVIVRGRGGIRLYLHRLPPHALTLKRLFRIGIPAGVENLLTFIANFGVIIIINKMDQHAVMAAAHINTIRIESISFLIGIAIATATATMVGQSLGMKMPRRASRVTWLAYAVGGGVMGFMGLLFIFLGQYPAWWLCSTQNPAVANLTTRCIFIAGFSQIGFAAWMIFSSALRGAGDTLSVMLIGLLNILILRFGGALFVGLYLQQGITAVWIVLAGELSLRGCFALLRFLQGRWQHVRV
jgi:putative MATE family efflux protein